MGGVLGAGGEHLGHDLEAWVDAELAKCGDDFSEFLARHSGLLATRHMGRTHYFAAPDGSAPEDFLQLEVEELQEVFDRKLIDPDRPPADRQELVEPIVRAKVDGHAAGSPRYRFVRLVDVRQVLAGQSVAQGVSPLARFMSDWSQSRAAERGRFCDHWLIAGLDRYDASVDTPFTAIPMSAHVRTLKPFQWDETKGGTDMGDQIRDFDRAAGYPGAWYFHVVAGALVPDTLPGALKRDLDGGYRYLADKELGLLERLVAEPYRAGLAPGASG